MQAKNEEFLILIEQIKNNTYPDTNLQFIVFKRALGRAPNSEEFLEILSALSSNTSIKTLNRFYGIQFDKDFATYLANFLKKNTSITKLDLDNMQLGDENFAVIAKVLKENTNLESINFINNKITDIGATLLAECIKSNTRLHEIVLIDNQITDTGASPLIEAFRNNENLKAVDLDFNSLTEKLENECKSICDARKKKVEPVEKKPTKIEPSFKITHTGLLAILKEFGYDLTMAGVCNGFTKTLERAISLGKEEKKKFFKRLDILSACMYEDIEMKDGILINKLEVDLKKVHEIIDKLKTIEEKVRNQGRNSLTEEELDYYEINAFLDNVYFFQYSQEEAETLVGTFLPYIREAVTPVQYMQTVSEMTQPLAYNNPTQLGPYACQLGLANLNEYLNQCVKIIESTPNVTLSIAGNKHRFLATFEPENKLWEFTDINDFGTYNFYFRQLTNEELAKAIFDNLHQKTTEKLDVLINAVLPENAVTKLSNELAILNTNFVDADLSLIYAIKMKDEVKVSEYLKKITDINKILHSKLWSKEASFLFVSCRTGDLKIVEQILKHPSIDINQVINEKLPINLACKMQNVALLNLLLKQPGIKIDLINPETKLPTIFTACILGNREMAMKLMEAGCAIDCRDSDGNTAIMVLVKKMSELQGSPIPFTVIKQGFKKQSDILFIKNNNNQTLCDLAFNEVSNPYYIIGLMNFLIEKDLKPQEVMADATVNKLLSFLRSENTKLNTDIKEKFINYLKVAEITPSKTNLSFFEQPPENKEKDKQTKLKPK